MPVDVYLNLQPPVSAATDYLYQHLERLEVLRERARKSVERAHHHQEQALRVSNRTTELKVGDLVLKKLHHRGRHKIQDHFGGPPLVVLKVPPPTGGPFVIRNERGLEQRVTGSELKKYYPPLSAPPASSETAPVPRQLPSRSTPRQGHTTYLTWSLPARTGRMSAPPAQSGDDAGAQPRRSARLAAKSNSVAPGRPVWR